MHSYVSFRRYRGEVRLTTYLAVEAYKPGTVEAGRNAPASGVIEVAKCFGRFDPIREHPFCRRMEREPIDARNLWVLLANMEAANDRSGACEALRLLSQGSDSAAPFKPPPDSTLDAWLRAGRWLHFRLAAIASSSNVDELPSVSMAIEVVQRQFDRFSRTSLQRWLGSDSGPDGCARVRGPAVDPPGLDTTGLSAGFGALGPESEVARATWQFFDELYALCYGRELPSWHPFGAQP
jgi:hypothetical protein